MPPVEILEVWALGPQAYIVAFWLGAVFGSFGNVCIYRLPPTDEHPNGLSIVSPGSRCGACETPIRWYDNIPILSFLLLRGKCRHCGAGYSPRYLFVEIATGMLFVAVYYLSVSALYPELPLALRLGRFAVYALFAFTLVVITFIDLDHRLILDKITYPAIPTFYGLGLLLPERHWSEGLIGAAVGYGVVRLISDGYKLITKKDGMGYGDGKLLAMIGALFGWEAVVVSLFGGSLAGSIIGVTVVALTRARERAAGKAPEGSIRHVELPFGPFLVVGALGYLFLEPWVKVSFGVLWGSAAGG